jgi:hypothetical protein
MKYGFGDPVLLTSSGRPCVVVATIDVDSPRLAETFKVPIGTILYTVELGDGSDALVREDDLHSDLSA